MPTEAIRASLLTFSKDDESGRAFTVLIISKNIVGGHEHSG